MYVSMYINVCQTYSQESPKALIDINLTHTHAIILWNETNRIEDYWEIDKLLVFVLKCNLALNVKAQIWVNLKLLFLCYNFSSERVFDQNFNNEILKAKRV